MRKSRKQLGMKRTTTRRTGPRVVLRSPDEPREPDYKVEPISSFLKRVIGKTHGMSPEELGRRFENAKSNGRAIRLMRSLTKSGTLIRLPGQGEVRYAKVVVPLFDGFPDAGLLNLRGLRDSAKRRSILAAAFHVYRSALATGARTDALRAAQAEIDRRVKPMKLDSNGIPIRIKGNLHPKMRPVQAGAPGSGKRR